MLLFSFLHLLFFSIIAPSSARVHLSSLSFTSTRRYVVSRSIFENEKIEIVEFNNIEQTFLHTRHRNSLLKTHFSSLFMNAGSPFVWKNFQTRFSLASIFHSAYIADTISRWVGKLFWWWKCWDFSVLLGDSSRLFVPRRSDTLNGVRFFHGGEKSDNWSRKCETAVETFQYLKNRVVK